MYIAANEGKEPTAKHPDESKFTDMMKHYLSLQRKYPGVIILYRLGDFYEMFFDDAIKASKILDLTLTARNCGGNEKAPMCGVPYHAVDNYISRLLAAGEKVAICEQLTAPGEQSGLLKRDVVRIITPGTNTIEEMLDGTVNHYLVAVARDKEQNTYAVSMLDIITGEFKVKRFHDAVLTDIEDFLLGITPSEIIADSAICAESRKLNGVICERLVKFTPVYDYSFDYRNACDSLLKQYDVYALEALGLSDDKVIVSALGGLLEYVSNTQKKSLSHISVPLIESDDEEMYIDYNTRKNLELTETLSDGKRVGSLLWVIDKTKTGMGARKLRNWLLHPLQKRESIIARQEAVSELYKNNTVRNSIANCLSKIKDLERIVTKISYGTINPRDCIVLKESLSVLPSVEKILNRLKSDFFVGLSNKYVDLTDLTEQINKVIKEDAPALQKDGGYIATGYNEELDSLRELKKGVGEIIGKFELKQREITGVPNLKVGYNRIFGYYIEIGKAKKPEVLPSDYIRKQTVANAERYINDELLKLEKEILGADQRILDLESSIYAEFKDVLYSKISRIKINAEIIAELDSIYSLAEVAELNNYCRPKITNNGSISIIDGRHPVVEQLLKTNEFVPNDTTLDSNYPVAILTGPNMAGKSTYIRQVASIVLLSHIGSFVPASKATISVVDRIFTRVGASDNLVRGQSTFMVEMLEVANIINNATENSLLILDEIGRGTSTLDGLSIAWAIVEHLLLKIKAKTLFATHYHELSELENLLQGIKNYRVLVSENKDGIAFLYKIARGGANKSFGIEVAEIAGINKSVIARARDILHALSQTHELSGDITEKMSSCITENSVISGQMSLLSEDDTFIEIKKILNATDLNRCTPIEALTILSDMKKLLK